MAYRGRFTDAARLFHSIGRDDRAFNMYVDLRMFNKAQVNTLSICTTKGSKGSNITCTWCLLLNKKLISGVGLSLIFTDYSRCVFMDTILVQYWTNMAWWCFIWDWILLTAIQPSSAINIKLKRFIWRFSTRLRVYNNSLSVTKNVFNVVVVFFSKYV